MQSIDDATYVSLRTYRKSGATVDTPVWIAPLDGGDGSHAVFSAGNAGKVKRLRNSSSAKVAVSDFGGKLLDDWVDASATIVSDEADIDRALRALRKKYGWQMHVADIGAKLTGKFNKRAYIVVKLVS